MTATKEAPLCALCEAPVQPLIKSDLGMVCRECKGEIVRAENSLSAAGIPPAHPSQHIPNN